jgi:hypothetical protein
MNDSEQMDLLGSTSSVEAFPARTSRRREIKQESMAKEADSGPNFADLLARYDPALRFWKTSQLSLLAITEDGLDEWSETWPRSGIAVSGIAYRHPNLARTTTEIASGLLPTPTAQDYGSNRSPTKGAAIRPSLQTMARKEMWPTPLAQEGGPDFAKIERCNRQSGKGLTLTTTVALKEREMWPTPLANEHKHGRPTEWEMTTDHGGTKDSLRVNVNKRTFPTPTARDCKGGYNTKSLSRKDGRSRTLNQLPNAALDGKGTDSVTGALNPNWVEWLMGFPIGHTDLDKLETPSYLSLPSYLDEE